MSKTPAFLSSLALALGFAAVGCKDTDRDEPAGKVVEPTNLKPADPVMPADEAAPRAQPTAPAMDEPARKVDPTVEPVAGDNTGVNERDRADHERTADNADMDESSVDTMAKIRRSILDGDFSTNADNVKIIVENGKVTLKGPVGSAAEKAAVEAKAADVVGAANVTSELTVTP